MTNPKQHIDRLLGLLIFKKLKDGIYKGVRTNKSLIKTGQTFEKWKCDTNQSFRVRRTQVELKNR
ncbi:unnamed protein product [Dovyalis caffra]|uniref:Uncharacterized protein n=1 Tax=Dovyalis caffra TaxID=77055 RepID=A0AAV1QMT0_9ROSI|nr:unnamed protein product [Dovyalis caffra]